MPLIKELKVGNTWELELDIQYKKFTFEENIISINHFDNMFLVRLGNIAKYYIYVNQNKITCVAENLESIFSTLFNIPFSVYLATRGNVLLHACSMKYLNELICFAGEKGVGKSTLTQMLNGEELLLYSDDTLRITEDLRGLRAHNLIKLTPETVEKLDVKQITNDKNIAGKIYGIIESFDSVMQVASIISIKRANQGPRLTRVHNGIIKKYMFFNNIVGVRYFPEILLKMIFYNDFYRNIKYFQLILPDCLHKLKLSRAKILCMLSSLMSE